MVTVLALRGKNLAGEGKDCKKRKDFSLCTLLYLWIYLFKKLIKFDKHRKLPKIVFKKANSVGRPATLTFSICSPENLVTVL